MALQVVTHVVVGFLCLLFGIASVNFGEIKITKTNIEMVQVVQLLVAVFSATAIAYFIKGRGDRDIKKLELLSDIAKEAKCIADGIKESTGDFCSSAGQNDSDTVVKQKITSQFRALSNILDILFPIVCDTLGKGHTDPVWDAFLAFKTATTDRPFTSPPTESDLLKIFKEYHNFTKEITRLRVEMFS